MFHRSAAPRFVTAAIVLLAVLLGSARGLRAQDATVAPVPGQSTLAPASDESSSGSGAASSAAAEAGPRIAPPLERYQPSLPRRDRAESSAMASGGGSHTVVLSTLALVLVVIIIVLLAVN